MLKIKGSEIATTINRVLAVVGTDQTVFFESDPKTNMLEIVAHNDLQLVRKRIPAVVEKAKRFALNGEIASKSFTYKDIIELSIKDTALRFKAEKGTWQGELFTQQFEDVRQIKRKSTHSIDKEVGEVLFKKLRKVALKPSFETGSLIAMVRTDKKKLRVAVADGYHGAILEEPFDLQGDLSFDMPIGYLDQIEKLVGANGAFELHQDPNCLYVLTPDLELSLPLIGSAPISYEQVTNGFNAFTLPSSSCTVSIDELRKTTKAMAVLFEPETAVFTLTIDKKGIGLELKSKHGRMAERVEAKDCVSDKKSIILDWTSFLDILDRVKDTVSIKVFQDQACKVEHTDGKAKAHYLSKGKTE